MQEYRVNDQIELPEVRLVDAEGEMIGVVSIDDALNRAADVGLDLVEVAPQASPPVCKLLDYGKFKYEAQKKASEAKKKQKTVNIKEIKMRLTIDVHDFEVKMRKVREFIEHGDKVKITIRFRGREMSRQDKAEELVERIGEHIEEYGKFEQEAKREGNLMGMLIGQK